MKDNMTVGPITRPADTWNVETWDAERLSVSKTVDLLAFIIKLGIVNLNFLCEVSTIVAFARKRTH